MTGMITEHVKLPGGVTAVLERPGARLVYKVAGDGPAVVLIHGFGLDMRMWDPQIGPLAARFRGGGVAERPALVVQAVDGLVDRGWDVAGSPARLETAGGPEPLALILLP